MTRPTFLEDEPSALLEGLAVPSAAAAERARGIMQGMMERSRAPTTVTQPTPNVSPRNYPIAYEVAGLLPQEAPALATPPVRPPPGAPTVRKSAKRLKRTTKLDTELLASATNSAMLQTSSDGTVSMEMAFRDDVLADVACTIHFQEGKVAAVFRVADVNMRRLFESEAGRLRVALEKSGLRVDTISVLIDSPDEEL